MSACTMCGSPTYSGDELCPGCREEVDQDEATQTEDQQQIRDAAMELIQHLAGDQCAEEVIDQSFNHPGLGERVNRLRKALGIPTK